MHFSQKTLNALEFSKIKEMLVERASTGGAKEKARDLTPTDDRDTVTLRLRRTGDARRLICIKGYPSFYAEQDIAESAQRAEKGAVLSGTELLRVASMLRCCRRLIDYIRTDKLFDTVLDEVFLRIVPNREVEDSITRAIISEDTVADDASPLLADIRRKIRQANNKIKDLLQSYVGGSHNKYLQENLVTMRDGRYVVPVKAEYRSEVKGLIHDTSSSGATVFIEPIAVVEANNELRRLGAEEMHEIERIMAQLSAMCGDFAYMLRQNYLNITDLAFVFACASLADDMKASCPHISSLQEVSLVRARHPLISKEKVVPIDVSLGSPTHMLVITGPNTGGKTVTLKTVGLLCLMAQSGLHIPASENSRLGIFSEILVDIGDEQSIEQSLSTFSAHMVNIVSILSEVTDRSLVLFDELGAGTDPVEGAAIAVAVLEKVRRTNALSLSTTHYAELKMYAIDTEGVENACCEFDVESLRPTYRLIVGMPGKSNAFAISEKLGLPRDIIDHASKLISGEARRFEDIVEQLDRSRQEMERNRELAEKMRLEYEEYKKNAERELTEKISQAQLSAQKDRERARQLLDSTRVSTEFIFKQLEDLRKQQGTDRYGENLANAKRALRERLGQAEKTYESTGQESYGTDEPYVLPRKLTVGDRVYMVSYGRQGDITAIDEKKNTVSVTAGILRVKVPMTDLRLCEKPRQAKPEKKRVSEGKVKTTLKNDFKIELDVRGEYTEDAWFRIDKYIDEAMVAGVESIHIVHGKGTGALRKFIQERLRTDRRVRSYRNGAYGEGDLGVTVIMLK